MREFVLDSRVNILLGKEVSSIDTNLLVRISNKETRDGDGD